MNLARTEAQVSHKGKKTIRGHFAGYLPTTYRQDCLIAYLRFVNWLLFHKTSFKACNSVASSVFTGLWGDHHLLPDVFSSVQFSCSVVSDSLQPHELQHARPLCPSPTPHIFKTL